MSQEPNDPDLNAIAASLGSLEPARTRIERDLVMFRAGQASVRPSRLRRRHWNVIAASFALLALGEGVLLAHRPPPQVVKEVVVIREPAAAQAPSPALAPLVPPVEHSVAEV